MENDLRARRSSKARLELRTSLFYTTGQAATEKKDGSPKESEEKETILLKKKNILNAKCVVGYLCNTIMVHFLHWCWPDPVTD